MIMQRKFQVQADGDFWFGNMHEMIPARKNTSCRQ